MSKQSDAKKAQNYSPTPTVPTCGNCANFRSERVLPAWMIRENRERGYHVYCTAMNGVEKNLRCGIGGFAVKKMGSCSLFVLPTEVA